jgi:HK97 family phage major capsid protein
MRTIAELQARLAELSVSAQAIQETVDREKRGFSADEQANIDSIVAEFNDVEAEIARRQSIANLGDRAAAPQPRAAAAALPGNGGEPAPAASRPANGGQQRARGSDGLQHTVVATAQERGRWGWQTFGDFCNAVRAVKLGTPPDTRLLNAAASTYGNEDIGADGAFAVPTEWREQIMQLVNGEDSLLARTDNLPISKNSITFPVDETPVWSSSAGVRAYWDKEAAAATQTKAAIQPLTMRLNKLTAMMIMTEELLEDAPAMSGYLISRAASAINWKVTDAIVNGDGAGMPLGLTKSPAAVTITEESSQPADTLVANNILKMYSRMHSAHRSRAVWLINQDVEPQLMNLNITFRDAAGTAGIAAGAAAYLPPGGLSGSPYASLMGRPIIPTEACATVGDIGDIIFVDLGAYLTVTKTTGIRSDISMHMYFDQGLSAFRFVLRLDGRPWLSAPIARANGSNTLSSIVLLESR